MLRRHLSALVGALMVVVAFLGVHAGLGAGDHDGWSSSLKSGDVVTRGTLWTVTVTPTPDEVEFWASGRVIATDTSAPFETTLDLDAGDYKLGFCYTKDGAQTCQSTEPGTGNVARVKVVEAAPPQSSSTPESQPPQPQTQTPPSSVTDAAAPATEAPATEAPATDRTGSSKTEPDSSSSLKSGDGSGPSDSSGSQSATGTSGGPALQTDQSSSAAQTRHDGGTKDRTDKLAPRPVRNVSVATAAPTSVMVQWAASRDNVGVQGYGLFLDGKVTGSTPGTQYNFGGLACGTGYLVGVDAFDAAGNQSSPTTTTVSTSACADLEPPSVPTGIALAAATESSAVLTWAPSKDNVGVVAYGLYDAGLRIASTSEPTATLGQLECGRSYQMGIDAVDAAGNRSGQATAYFSTQPCADTQPPSKPTGLAVSANATSITLSWSAATDNVGVAGYGVYRGSGLVETTTQRTATVGGLSCGTTYTVGVDAFDGAGNRSDKAAVSAATAPCADTSSPSAPGSLHVMSTSATSLGVAWSASTDNTGVSAYELYVGTRKVGTATQTSGTFTGLSCGTSYQLGVDAIDAAGNRSSMATLSASTQGCVSAADTTAPSTPSSLRVVSANATSVSLAWSASTDDTSVAGYGVYRGSTAVATTTQTTATIGGLTCGTAYQLGVDAFDAAGNRSSRANLTVTTSACADTQAPSVPINVVAGTRTATSIALSWSSSTDNVGVVGYGLYRGGSLVSTNSGTTGIVGGLTCGTNYTLGVDAFDAAGNRSSEAVVMVSTAACADTQAPTAPTGLKATNITQTGLTLSWTASTDNVGVTGYDVYRNGTKVASSTVPTYVSTSLTCNTAYTLAVVSFDSAGNRSPQAQLVTSTAACLTPTSAVVSVAPSGSDSSCSRGGVACRSWQRAFDVAQSGDVINVAGGTYPAQTLSGDKSVTFRVAQGQTATFNARLTAMRLSNVQFEGPIVFSTNDLSTDLWVECSTNLKFTGLSGKTFWIYNTSTNITITGGDWGNYRIPDYGDSAVSGYDGSGSSTCGDGIVRNVLIDGVYFHDVHYWASGNWGGAHPDCLEAYGGVVGLTVQNSVFERCGNTFMLMLPTFGELKDVTFQNNVMRAVYESFYSIQLGENPGSTYHCSNLVFRYNTVDVSVGHAAAPPRLFCPTQSVYGNTFTKGPGTGGSSQCLSGWSYNVFESGPCGANATVGTVSFVGRPTSDSGSADYHLAAGSLAIGKGNPNAYPSTDFEGTARSSPPDAGYDER
jgi:chitodextrinase